MTRLLVSDLDGALNEGYISMDFLDYLNKTGLYPNKSYDKQMKLLDLYHNNLLNYEEWCTNWGEEWGRGLSDQKVEDIYNASGDFFLDFKHKIYPLSRNFVNYFRENGYVTMLLSLGAEEVVSRAGIELGFDKFYGTRAESENGIYTGNVSTKLHKPGGKEFLLREIINSDYDTLNSLGAGDSFSDLGFMRILGKQIALNPEKKLSVYANKNGIITINFNNMDEDELNIWLDEIIRGDNIGLEKIK